MANEVRLRTNVGFREWYGGREQKVVPSQAIVWQL